MPRIDEFDKLLWPLLFDMVELCPNPTNKAPDFLAAKLYYKLLSYKYDNEDESENYDDDYDMNIDSPFNKLSKFKDNDDY